MTAADQDGHVEDARVIAIPGDEEQWPSLLEVGSEVVARGGLVVLPTDTLYGVGCDPFNPSAVDALFVAKQRGRDLPLPVLVHTWPGPLTLVFKEAAGIGWDLGESRGTVAVRMPKQTFALALIQRTGPLAVSSANRSGEPTPATMPGIVEQLGDDVGVFFDAGPAPSGPASTIVDLSGPRPRLLREGAIPAAEIERVLEEPFDDAD
jgi:L-threonylcarbamoyladenylate synthase